ncbi:UBP-type zinc finger domain-containing protein [Actinokineospora inagensis]|uniref:UBP-type zinc finger domain-containing protein n=1 Tax=Actinokineospora inagensis TaxID=103730 RepID=UPI0003F8DAB8|nr:UBP-type zinc finger domain-containing protein [Actinokineospora inagensis]
MSCDHTTTLPTLPADPTDTCGDCVAEGNRHWVHLRRCLTCGHVACCDSSPRKHATAHHHATTHPVMQSHEPGESWRWCFIDERIV